MDDSMLSSRLPELQTIASRNTASTSDQYNNSDHRDRRCDSVGDRGTTSRGGCSLLMSRNSIPKPPKPEEPIEIKVDFKRVQAPVEYCFDAATKVAMI